MTPASLPSTPAGVHHSGAYSSIGAGVTRCVTPRVWMHGRLD